MAAATLSQYIGQLEKPSTTALNSWISKTWVYRWNLFLTVLCAEIVLLPVLGGRHIYFRYNATAGDIVDNTTEQLDLENMCIASNSVTIGEW